MIEILGGLGANISLGLETALTWQNLAYCFFGVSIGMLVGVIPGIGSLAAISMLFPITFHLDPTSALIMLGGIFYGTVYGGSTAAILLNVPGTPSSAVTSIDGYPMSKSGRGGVALLLTTTSSFIGGSIGILLMMLFSPLIVGVALQFAAFEYFALMVLGLVVAATVSDTAPAKGIAMVVVGVLIGVVGMDMYTGQTRFTFGIPYLFDGVSLVALAMGLFGISEIISSVRSVHAGRIEKVTFRSMVPTRDDVRRSWMPTLRGTAIGSFFGTLPGTGNTIASFMSYAVEKRIAREPERFGKGAVEGICAPEAANNAADQTSFIPTMTLGIPGSPVMALILGVLIIHGIQPGPTLVIERPEMFWGLVMSFWIGNLLLLILNIPLIGLWIRVLQIPYHLLYPSIIMFICIGVYSVNNSAFDIWMVMIFGALGYLMRLLDFSAPPLLLGFVLGPLMEEHFRRAMIFSNGDFSQFLTRPISGTIMALTLLVLLWTVFVEIRRANRRPRSPAA